MLCTIARVTFVVCVTEQLCRTQNTNEEYVSAVQRSGRDKFVSAVKQQQQGVTVQRCHT